MSALEDQPDGDDAVSETCPLPADEMLASVARALNDAGHWAEVFDPAGRYVYMSDNARWIYGGAEMAPVPLGHHIYSPESIETRMAYRNGHFTPEVLRDGLRGAGPWLLAAVEGDRDALRALVDPRLHDVLDDVGEPVLPDPAFSYLVTGIYGSGGDPVQIPNIVLALRDTEGTIAGYVLISKPAVGMATLARTTALGDLGHFERMGQVIGPDRRPSAILFADIESSSPLSRRLPTAAYFDLGRRIARAADRSVIDAGGLVGRHAGDGVVAFFVGEVLGSESAAARGCIEAARSIRAAMGDVADESELPTRELVMRFGLHWGATLYIGQIVTTGRTEVTGLGDEVNEAARIEASASGGRLLASKALVERLTAADAAALGLDLERIVYTPLADLPGATEKARRDAPAIAVCEV